MIKLNNFIVFISTSPEGLNKANFVFRLPCQFSTSHRTGSCFHL